MVSEPPPASRSLGEPATGETHGSPLYFRSVRCHHAVARGLQPGAAGGHAGSQDCTSGVRQRGSSRRCTTPSRSGQVRQFGCGCQPVRPTTRPVASETSGIPGNRGATRQRPRPQERAIGHRPLPAQGIGGFHHSTPATRGTPIRSAEAVRQPARKRRPITVRNALWGVSEAAEGCPQRDATEGVAYSDTTL